jgi:hypothetical protein
MALDEDDVTEALEGALQNPAEVESDGLKVKEQKIKDLIELDRHLAAKRAHSTNPAGLRFGKFVAPGSV